MINCATCLLGLAAMAAISPLTASSALAAELPERRVPAARVLLGLDVPVIDQPLRGVLLVHRAVAVGERDLVDKLAVHVDLGRVVRVAVGAVEPPPADDGDRPRLRVAW